MGLIVKRLEIYGDKGKVEADVLFDSGARSSAIRKDVAEKIATMVPLPEPQPFTLADVNAKMISKYAIIGNCRIDGVRIDGRFYVLENLRREVVIGADVMQNWSITLNPATESLRVAIDPEGLELF